MKTRYVLLAVVLLSLGGLAGLQNGTAASETAESKSDPASPDPGSKFAILRQESGAAADPAEARVIRRTLNAHSGSVDPFGEVRSVRLAKNASGIRVHVVETAKAVCVAVRAKNAGGSFGCSTAEVASQADTPMLTTTFVDDDEWRVSGLMQDGVRNVRIDTVDGSNVVGAVESNVFISRLGSHPSSISWQDEQGQQYRENLRPVGQ